MIQGPRFLVRQRRRVREWGRRHPRTLALLERIGCMRFDRAGLARGVAIGLFVALTPTVGLQTLLMLAFCLLLRGNFPLAFAVSWISNPITLAPLYLGYYLLGERVLAPLVDPLSPLWEAGSASAVLEGLYLLVGSLLIAAPIAAAGYGASLWLGSRLARRGAT